MHICVCVCVCVLQRLVASGEAVCRKASLALTRGPTARAGGMKLKLTTQEKMERKSEREEEEVGGGGEKGGGGETKDNKDAEEDGT